MTSSPRFSVRSTAPGEAVKAPPTAEAMPMNHPLCRWLDQNYENCVDPTTAFDSRTESNPASQKIRIHVVTGMIGLDEALPTSRYGEKLQVLDMASQALRKLADEG